MSRPVFAPFRVSLLGVRVCCESTPLMNTQLLVETANRLVDDDKGILAMNCRYKSRQPWQLSFSYGRALQQPVLEVWRGEAANVEAAQKVLMHRARCNRAARRGEYTAEMECQ